MGSSEFAGGNYKVWCWGMGGGVVSHLEADLEAKGDGWGIERARCMGPGGEASAACEA